MGEQGGPKPEGEMTQSDHDEIFKRSLDAMARIGIDDARPAAADYEGDARIGRQMAAAEYEMHASAAAADGDREAYKQATDNLNRIHAENEAAKAEEK